MTIHLFITSEKLFIALKFQIDILTNTGVLETRTSKLDP